MSSLTQSFEFETDSKDSLETVLKCMVPIIFGSNFLCLEPPSSDSYRGEYDDLEDGKKKFERLPLTTLAIDRSKTGLPLGWDEAIKSVMKIINNIDKECIKKFIEECGRGYHYAFNRYDGHTGLGYRVYLRDFPTKLDISLVHIYYGK